MTLQRKYTHFLTDTNKPKINISNKLKPNYGYADIRKTPLWIYKENTIGDIFFKLYAALFTMLLIIPTSKDTPFKDFKNRRLNLTLRLISILWLMFQKTLIPATTAIGTIPISSDNPPTELTKIIFLHFVVHSGSIASITIGAKASFYVCNFKISAVDPPNPEAE